MNPAATANSSIESATQRDAIATGRSNPIARPRLFSKTRYGAESIFLCAVTGGSLAGLAYTSYLKRSL